MTSRPTHDAVQIVKAVLWEEAKGKLRALVAAEGSRYSTPEKGEPFKHEVISEEIEAFIKAFEGEEYNL
jgi:hypothetical protein